MRYGKLKDGHIQYAPRVLRRDGWQVINPTAEQLAAEGFKEIIRDPYPNLADNETAEMRYVEAENSITITYDVVEIEDDDSAEEADYLNALERFGVTE